MGIIKAIGRTFAVTFKRLYDILATYLLFWVLYLASVAVGLHFAFELLWTRLGVENPELVWTEMAAGLPADVTATKFAVIIMLHIVLFVVLRRPISWVQPHVEKLFDSAGGFFDRITSEKWSLRLFGESLFTVTISALLIPFIIQPTLVRGWDVEDWAERGTNLVNGTAVLDLPESVIGYYSRFGAEAVAADEGVDAADLSEAFANAEKAQELEDAIDAGADLQSVEEIEPEPEVKWGGAPQRQETMTLRASAAPQPVMDRWDDHIRDGTQHSDELFPYVKAFMYVESGGRQYAVSNTGCKGLMQFCASTARDAPYRDVFGRGKIYVCGCRGAECKVSRSVQIELESGDPSRVQAQEDNFPCEMTDARFDPDRAVRAGSLYVRRLHQMFDGNIYMMYIGYNSGPAVARRLLAAVDYDTGADLQEIAMHLPDALRPFYGSGANRRAKGLTRIHLPKIQRALQRYGGPTEAEMLGDSDVSVSASVAADATDG